ncbi:UDP-glucose:undecaprenyl-phosphate glucose-1-phosphate transferase [Sodalis glossinidius str. 'morsitans']|uniref:Extracellular polysaccharide biosynthesis protein n=1 Tax=Sodalis glossinidius (strain morsitans) TaxID=343509 RepID=Q2NUB4_SODGM|nr:undecaprenyl-phosphate glucose phosphotransferase [Sodalis glossinidius]BAE74261.1 putative extracellular polysaccharide biosynthesis protein [Sodalis glossinidius str. 'morsitans']CRL44847.1 UDP-glucose:undecaprenyl-phosphate glucose-1-phosphate transferase [Sodalis glossinidius str. 'morsitans']
MNSIISQRTSTNESLISVIRRFSDIFIMFFALFAICQVNNIPMTNMHFFVVLVALVVFQMIGGITDFYHFWRGVKIRTELLLILQNWTLSLIITAGIISFVEVVNITFMLYAEWYLLACIGLVFCRLLIRHIIGMVRHRGYNTRNVAIVGNSPVGVELATSLLDVPWLGFNIVGIYSDNPVEIDERLNYISEYRQVIEDAKSGKLERVYIAMPMTEEAKIKDLVDELCDTTCSIMLIPDIFTFSILRSRSEDINGLPVLSIADMPLNGINMVLKRIEDIVLSLMILLFITPVLLVISCMVKFTSPGPIIFRQKRYGIDCKPILVWKFRSMNVMDDGDTIVQAKRGDSRLTPIGGFLRRTSLDELPQFINVLKGDMSIVGPRPHAVAHNEQYRSLIKGYMLRHKVKPGITGWAQVNGWRGETDSIEKMQRRVDFDLEYIREWSILMDLKIIFFTVFKGFMGKSAY